MKGEFKMEKRIIAFVLILCMIFVLAGCSADENPEKYVELQRYDYFQVDKTMVEVAESDVETYVWSQVHDFIEFNYIEEGTLKYGDAVTADFDVLVGGESVEGLIEDYTFVIGSETFIGNVEEMLVGVDVGETVTITERYPDEYIYGGLAGKRAEFVFTIKNIIDIKYPELTDEFVFENTGYANKEELFAESRAFLERENLSDVVWQRILGTATVKSYPQAMVNRYVDHQIAVYQDIAKENGMSFKDFLEEYYGYTKAEFRAALEERCLESVKEELVVRAIAKEQGITLSEEEYLADVNASYAEYGFETPEDFVAEYGENNIKVNLMLRKVLDYIISTCEYIN